MYIIKNELNGKVVKNCCTMKPFTFDTRAEAEDFAHGLFLHAVLDNHKAKYIVKRSGSCTH